MDVSARVEIVQRAVEEFDASEVRQFAAWFSEFEHGVWDRQVEEDSKSGRLDFLRAEADSELIDSSLKDV